MVLKVLYSGLEGCQSAVITCSHCFSRLEVTPADILNSRETFGDLGCVTYRQFRCEVCKELISESDRILKWKAVKS